VSHKKRKRTQNRENSQNIGTLTNLEDMEIESTNLPNWVARRIVESQEITQNITIEEPMFFDNQPLTLHNTQYKRHEKKLHIDKVSIKHKNVVQKLRSVVNASGVATSKLMKLHHSVEDSLSNSI
jgi:hypothetical protein